MKRAGLGLGVPELSIQLVVLGHTTPVSSLVRKGGRKRGESLILPSPQLGRRRRRRGAARLDAGRVRLPRLEEDARAFISLSKEERFPLDNLADWTLVNDEKRIQT